MHKRARAHVRAAEKYMEDDTRKAIAHFGRAMHYFGGEDAPVSADPNETKEQPIFGFIVLFVSQIPSLDGQSFDYEQRRVAYLFSDVRVMACSGDHTFSELPKDRHMHKMWKDDLSTVQVLAKHYQKASPAKSCHSSELLFNQAFREQRKNKTADFTFDDAHIEHSLFVTHDITKSAALFIRSNRNGRRSHIVFDMDGVVSVASPVDSSTELRAFLSDPKRATYKLRNSSFGEEGIESIEFEKMTDSATNRSVIRARLAHSDAKEMAGLEQRIRGSETPFTDAMAILYENKHIQLVRAILKSKPHTGLFEENCENQAKTLMCWLDIAKVSGHITDQELEAFKADITSAQQTTGTDKLDIDRSTNLKYIMLVLRSALSKEETVDVVCIGKREFACADIHELLRPKDPSVLHLYDFSLPVHGFGTLSASHATGRKTMLQGCPVQ